MNLSDGTITDNFRSLCETFTDAWWKANKEEEDNYQEMHSESVL